MSPKTPTRHDPPDRHAITIDAIRAICDVLDQLPLADQVTVVKVLTARTLVNVAEHQGIVFERAAPLTLSA